MGCANPQKDEGGSAHPISVLELTKDEVDESSKSSDVRNHRNLDTPLYLQDCKIPPS